MRVTHRHRHPPGHDILGRFSCSRHWKIFLIYDQLFLMNECTHNDYQLTVQMYSKTFILSNILYDDGFFRKKIQSFGLLAISRRSGQEDCDVTVDPVTRPKYVISRWHGLTLRQWRTYPGLARPGYRISCYKISLCYSLLFCGLWPQLELYLSLISRLGANFRPHTAECFGRESWD